MDLPHSFQVHGADFDDMADSLIFQNTISLSPGHAYHVKQFGPIDKIVV